MNLNQVAYETELWGVPVALSAEIIFIGWFQTGQFNIYLNMRSDWDAIRFN